MKKHIYFFIGTTAEFIKIAPIIKELKKRKINFKIITAGQTKIHFEEFELYAGKVTPYIALDEKVNKSSPLYFSVWAIRTIITAPFILYPELKDKTKKNCYFIIHGDPVTSFIGAIIAKLFRLTLVHIESGDLSFNLLEPFPEEICRNVNIRLADIMFPPTDWAKNNVKKFKGKAISTGEDTVIESCLWALHTNGTPNILKKLKKYYILIMHRQEHVIFKKGWSKKIMRLVLENADKNLNCMILNHPLTARLIEEVKPELPKRIQRKIILTERVPYTDFQKLMNHAEFIATDGASNQQEVYYMGKPCLSLRDYTEQTEGLNENVILCKSDENIIKEFLKNYQKYKRKPVKLKKRPSKIVVDYLMSH